MLHHTADSQFIDNLFFCGFQIQLDFFVTREKNVLKTFFGGAAPGVHSTELISQSLYPNVTAAEERIPKAGIKVIGDLPTLVIYLNQPVFNSLLDSIRIVTSPLPKPLVEYTMVNDKQFIHSGDENTTHHHSIIERSTSLIHHHNDIYQHPDLRSHPLTPSLSTSPLLFHFSPSSRRSILQHNRSPSPHLQAKPKLTDVIGATIETRADSTSSEDQESWPPDFVAKFSLVRFELSVDCLPNYPIIPDSGILQLSTDSVVVGFSSRPGITSIDFCLGEITLSRPAEHSLSPYRYILRTGKHHESLSPTDGDPLLNNTAVSSTLENDPDNSSFIVVKLAFANQVWSKQVRLHVHLTHPYLVSIPIHVTVIMYHIIHTLCLFRSMVFRRSTVKELARFLMQLSGIIFV